MFRIASMQTICDNRTIVNHHPFGRELAELRPHIDELFKAFGLDCGPMDGGCLAFAEALRAWMRLGRVDDGSRLVFVGRPDIPDHVAVEITGHEIPLFADGDGLAGANELRQKLVVIERLVKASFRPFDVLEAEEYGLLSYEEIGLPAALLQLFGDRLGPFKPDRTSLPYLN